jgi:hypothetical protein
LCFPAPQEIIATAQEDGMTGADKDHWRQMLNVAKDKRDAERKKLAAFKAERSQLFEMPEDGGKEDTHEVIEMYKKNIEDIKVEIKYYRDRIAE